MQFTHLNEKSRVDEQGDAQFTHLFNNIKLNKFLFLGGGGGET